MCIVHIFCACCAANNKHFLLYICAFNLKSLWGTVYIWSECVCHSLPVKQQGSMFHTSMQLLMMCLFVKTMLIKNDKAKISITRTRRFKTSFFCAVVSLFLGCGAPLSLIKCKPDSSNSPPCKQLQPDPWGSIKRHSVETWKKAPWKWIIASTPPHPDPSIPCACDHKKEHGGQGV